jgi:hypothetical protein
MKQNTFHQAQLLPQAIQMMRIPCKLAANRCENSISSLWDQRRPWWRTVVAMVKMVVAKMVADYEWQWRFNVVAVVVAVGSKKTMARAMSLRSHRRSRMLTAPRRRLQSRTSLQYT